MDTCILSGQRFLTRMAAINVSAGSVWPYVLTEDVLVCITFISGYLVSQYSYGKITITLIRSTSY